MYTNRKPARCLIDIKNGILTSASHLIIILFALSYLKSFLARLYESTGRAIAVTPASASALALALASASALLKMLKF